MEKNMIELDLSKKTELIMGNKYGQAVYEDQVKSKIDPAKMNVVVFPEYIKFVSMSFVQGFINALTTEYGREKAFSMIELKSNYSHLDERLKKAMFF